MTLSTFLSLRTRIRRVIGKPLDAVHSHSQILTSLWEPTRSISQNKASLTLRISGLCSCLKSEMMILLHQFQIAQTDMGQILIGLRFRLATSIGLTQDQNIRFPSLCQTPWMNTLMALPSQDTLKLKKSLTMVVVKLSVLDGNSQLLEVQLMNCMIQLNFQSQLL